MMFNLKLDESLFDDDFELSVEDEQTTLSTEYDDDFSEYEDSHDLKDVLPGPSQGADTGVASELIALINDEWEAIQGYNDAIASLRENISANPFYEKAIRVLEEISAEENVHVGQLQEVLKQISPNASEIKKGAAEAKSQLGLVGGILPVQTWEDSRNTERSSENVNSVDETCTIMNVDDEM